MKYWKSTCEILEIGLWIIVKLLNFWQLRTASLEITVTLQSDLWTYFLSCFLLKYSSFFGWYGKKLKTAQHFICKHCPISSKEWPILPSVSKNVLPLADNLENPIWKFGPGQEGFRLVLARTLFNRLGEASDDDGECDGDDGDGDEGDDEGDDEDDDVDEKCSV